MEGTENLHGRGEHNKLTLRMSDNLNQRTRDKAGYLGISQRARRVSRACSRSFPCLPWLKRRLQRVLLLTHRRRRMTWGALSFRTASHTETSVELRERFPRSIVQRQGVGCSSLRHRHSRSLKRSRHSRQRCLLSRYASAECAGKRCCCPTFSRNDGTNAETNAGAGTSCSDDGGFGRYPAEARCPGRDDAGKSYIRRGSSSRRLADCRAGGGKGRSS